MISRAISEKSRVDSRLAFPAIFVPSIATTSGRTSPACAHNPSTWLNTSASAISWRSTNRAIVA